MNQKAIVNIYCHTFKKNRFLVGYGTVTTSLMNANEEIFN